MTCNTDLLDEFNIHRIELRYYEIFSTLNTLHG